MDLQLPAPPARYRSGSQRARVASEAWATANLYCPRCDSDSLNAHRAGEKISDFACLQCKLSVQLKSKSSQFRGAFVNSAYQPKIDAIRARTLPDYALMSYDLEAWRVTDLTIIPGHFITMERVLARNPLRVTARRAGWVGSTVVLRDLPPDAFVRVIDESQVRPRSGVRRQYGNFAWLKRRAAESAGWMADVLREVRSIAPIIGTSFSLAELYGASVDRLALAHPENKHVQDKIRQQLQALRERGFLRFDGRGTYTVLR